MKRSKAKRKQEALAAQAFALAVAACPPLHLLVQVDPVAVAAIVAVIMTGQVVLAAGSREQDSTVTVSDDGEWH